jgi:putative oxidoreductase
MKMNRAVQATYFLLRVVAGFLFCQAGALILFGWYGGMPDQPSPPPLFSQTGIGGILEFFGGIMIVLGLFTRPVAFILSGMMAVAYWQFHAPLGRWPVQNQGMPAVLFCFIFLYMAAQGAGDWSLDALIHRKRGNTMRAA